MPEKTIPGVVPLDTHYTTDIQLESAFSDASSAINDIVEVLGDAHDYVEVVASNEYSLVAYCNPAND